MNVFKIALVNGLYEVSIPDYPGGDVVEYETAKALSDELAAERAKVAKLRDSLDFIADAYCDLVNSGDAGFWNPEKDAEVMQAREALYETKPNEPKRLN